MCATSSDRHMDGDKQIDINLILGKTYKNDPTRQKLQVQIKCKLRIVMPTKSASKNEPECSFRVNGSELMSLQNTIQFVMMYSSSKH